MYAYSQGLGSAREVARRCEYDPAFQWLTGLEEVNYHTLADFRVEKQKELDELFTQVLAALSKERLITLEQVMQDGTKIKALASTGSYHHKERFGNTWSVRGNAWRRWVIRGAKKAVRKPEKRRSAHGESSKSDWRVRWKSCRSAGAEKKPRAKRG